MTSPTRIGISSCLLGDAVRYDGGHKRHAVLLEEIGAHVEWIPVCPEVEVGMGVPRPPIRLLHAGDTVALVEPETGTDYTRDMQRFAQARGRALERAGIDGYVCKSRSPSCGRGDAPVYGPEGEILGEDDGVFIAALRSRLPDLPVLSERGLETVAMRENFLARCEAHRTLRHAAEGRLLLTDFHRRYWIFFHARSPSRGQELGELAERQQVATYAEIFFRETERVPEREDHLRALEWAQFEMTPVTTPYTHHRLGGVVGAYASGAVSLRQAVETLRTRAAESRLRSFAQDAYLYPSAGRLRAYEEM